MHLAAARMAARRRGVLIGLPLNPNGTHALDPFTGTTWALAHPGAPNPIRALGEQFPGAGVFRADNYHAITVNGQVYNVRCILVKAPDAATLDQVLDALMRILVAEVWFQQP